ncbi:replication termination factor 2-like [Diadema antillarum]|uniref:replication termination factor 2-like n=1 Tax=Diadema antillarum TaxID=105358 RepID=UPI003A865B1A
MGGDGGSIPGRQDLVRTRRKPERADHNMERVAKWHHCAITQEKLRQPIVSCELGRLYNKEAVLEYLLDKSKCDSAQHIKSLKDIRQLNLTDNPAYKGEKGDKGDSYVDRHTAPYICPVTGLEMNGKYRFCFMWNCGCVMSEKAFKEVKSDICHKCGQPFSSDDGIIIHGTEEDVKLLTVRMEQRRALAKAQKKAKKAQKRKANPELASESTPSTSEDAGSNGLNRTSCLNKKFVAARKEDNIKATSDKKPGLPQSQTQKTTLDPSIMAPEYNSKNSKVYKSLFLSKDSKEGEQAHWVTYNPYYAMRH